MSTKTILTTFDYARSPIFFKTLEHYGFSTKALPVLSLSLYEDLNGFDTAVRKLHSFDLVVFSSPTVVKFFFLRLLQLRIAPTTLDNCRLIAIGPSTAKALRQQGFSPDFIPREFTSNCLVSSLSKLKKDQRILIPCSDKSLWHSVITSTIGCKVSTPILYSNRVPNIEWTDQFIDSLTNEFSGIVFTSPSTVEHLSDLSDKLPIEEILNDKVVACIGPTTSKACRERNIKVTIQPKKYTITDLMWSVIHHYNAQCIQTT